MLHCVNFWLCTINLYWDPFRSNVRSTVSRILNIYAESRKSSIVNHCIKQVRLNSRVNYRAELLRGRRKGLNRMPSRMRMERETPEKQN